MCRSHLPCPNRVTKKSAQCACCSFAVGVKHFSLCLGVLVLGLRIIHSRSYGLMYFYVPVCTCGVLDPKSVAVRFQ